MNSVIDVSYIRLSLETDPTLHSGMFSNGNPYYIVHGHVGPLAYLKLK